MAVPVVLLAFANDRTGQLASLRAELARERREIRALFSEAVRAGWCQVELLVDATPRDVVQAFQNPAWRERIVGFHFSGHADSEHLLFESEDGGVAAAAGMDLAAFLGRQKGLQWIFLNGCATEGHVAALLDTGVRAVIATQRKVDSVAACEFAIMFYRVLAEGQRSLLDAFEEARTGVSLANGAVSRGLAYHPPPDSADLRPRPTWVFSVRPGQEAVTDWCLNPDPLQGLPLPADIGLPAQPFLNLQSFGREHARIFFGRGAFIRSLYDSLTDSNNEPILLLCGQSGVGKSSLLFAGLLPRLEASFDLVLMARPPSIGIMAQLLALLGCGESFAEAWRERESTQAKPLLLVIDHAEELLPDNGASPQEWEVLRQSWALLFNSQPRPRGKLVLVFRKEWLADLSAGLDQQQLAHSCKVLERLDRAGIIESVEGVGKDPRCFGKYRLTLAADAHGLALAAHIAADLLADRQAPIAPTLQILLQRLWARAKALNDAEPVIDMALYEQEKRRGLLLEDFFRERLAELAQLHPPVLASGLALDILYRHTSELGTAAECTRSQLAQDYAHCPQALQQVVAFFKACFVLADATGPGRDADKATRLSHDTLAPLVCREYQRSVRPGQQARRILEERGKQAGGVLPQEDLLTVERGQQGMRVWTAAEAQMVAAAQAVRHQERQRRARLHGLLSALGGALLAMVIAIAWQWSEALRYQSLVLAGQSRQEAQQGHSTLALLLAIEALPSTQQLRPWVDDAETALAFALSQTLEQAAPNPPGQVWDATFAADGRLVAIASNQGVWLWDLAKSQEQVNTDSARKLLSGDSQQVLLSADSRYLLTVSAEGTQLWASDTGVALVQVQPVGAVMQAALSPQGDRIATLGKDGRLRLWHVAKSKDVGVTTALTAEVNLGARASHLAYSHDGAQIAVAIGKEVRVLNADNGLGLQRLAHAETLTQTDFSPNGRWLATASAEGHVWLWDRADGQQHLQLAQTASVEVIAFSPDSQWLATADSDNRVRIWSLASGRELFHAMQDSPVWRLGFTADGKQLAIVTQTNGLRLLNVTNLIDTFRVEHQAAIEAAEFSPDGRWLATASVDGTVLMTDARTGVLRWRWVHGSEVSHISFSPDGKLLASAAADGIIRLWDTATGLLQRQLLHQGKLTRVVFERTGNRLVSASAAGSVRVWSAETGAMQLELNHNGPVHDAVFSPDGQWLATASADHSARLWSANTGQERFRWQHGGDVRQVSFSPDGQQLVTASADHFARVFGVVDGVERWRLAHQDSVESALFSPDGQWLVTASSDTYATLWSAANGKPRWQLAHGLALSYAAFSPDSQHIVTAMRETLGESGADMGARVWDVATGQQRFAIRHDASLVKAVFSPDGLGVLTVSPDKSARFWARAGLLRSGFALLETARASALPRQALTAAERRRFFLDDD